MRRIDSRFTRRKGVSQRWKSVKDPQRHLLYSMEQEWLGTSIGCTTDRDVLLSVVRHACRKWNIPIPALGKETRKKIYGSSDGYDIFLNQDYDGHNLPVLLHELAHHFTSFKYGDDVEEHGIEFCGVYRRLLDDYKVMPAIAFDELAIEYDVQWMSDNYYA